MNGYAEKQETTMTPEDLIEDLKNAPPSYLVESICLTLRTMPAKRAFANEQATISKVFPELFLYSYRKLKQKSVRDKYSAKAEMHRKQIRSQLKNIRQNIAKLTEKWQALLGEMQYEINTNYSAPARISLEYKTPEEREFYDIITSMDFLFVVMDNLWQAKELDLDKKNSVTTNVVSQIIALRETSIKLLSSIQRLKRDAERKSEISEMKSGL